jgi:5'-methylthioadenosine phosphorylase
MEDAVVGIIGGTGLDDIEVFENKRTIQMETPFGLPSCEITVGEISHVKTAFLPRHGKGHAILPSEINYRANIFALKQLGVQFLLSVSAVGSLKEEIAPLHIVLPDQFYDRTKNRMSSFFGNGIVAHVNFSDPTCEDLRKIVRAAGTQNGINMIDGGTYVCIEGPQFSTRAESNTYRKLDFDIIGMTNIPEAKLAREAELCYCSMALVTDYDCWHPDYREVDINMVFDNLTKNSENAKKIIRETVANIPNDRRCVCGNALEYGIITNKELIPDSVKADLNPIIGKYM